MIRHNNAMQLKDVYKGASSPSARALIAANMVPVLGAIFLHWSVAALLLLFWTENVIIGVMNIVKLLTIKREGKRNPFVAWIGKIFVSLLFIVHYGGFCAGHGIGVLILMGVSFYIEDANSDNWPEITDMLFKDKLIYAIAALFISHLVSLISNWFLKKERYGKNWEEVMKQPYARVVALHITIVIGAIPMLLLRSPAAGLALLMVIKTGIDLQAHLKERIKSAPSGALPESSGA